MKTIMTSEKEDADSEGSATGGKNVVHKSDSFTSSMSAKSDRAKFSVAGVRKQQEGQDKIKMRPSQLGHSKVTLNSQGKPNFGGYYNTRNRKVYLHASAQTIIRPPLLDPLIKLECRETQTAEICNRSAQSTKDNSTQMTKIGVYVSNINDKIIIPRYYVTADQYIKKYIKKIIIVQKQVRCFLAKKRVNALRRNYQEHLNWLKMQEEKRRKEKENRIQETLLRQQHPKSRADFNILYSAVEKWYKEKSLHLTEFVSGPELKAALYLLGEKENELLNIIHQHKLIAQEINRTEGFRNMLDKTSASLQWKNQEGKVTNVYTTSILRAKELHDLYHTLSLKGLNDDERLDALITLKQTVMEFDSSLSREIMNLVDREADLLVREIKGKYLGGLRQRLLVLFLQFIRTPKFNPEYKKAYQDPKEKMIISNRDKQICPSCGWLYSINKFVLLGNTPLLRRCQQCVQIENEAFTRNDFSLFVYMLAQLRVEEGKLDAMNSVAFLLSVRDFRYLVETIWNGRSLMSAENDLYDLVICRWNKKLDWAPWNCILLTNEEAVTHYKVKSLSKSYDKSLIQKVKQKNLMAKNYFSQILCATQAFNKV